MTTSGTYTFSVNRDDIVRTALLTIRKLDEVEGPTAQDTADCSRLLNMLVKQWQGKADFAPGLKTWMRRKGNLFLSNSTGRYTLGPSGTGWTESFTQTKINNSVLAASAILPLESVTGLLAGDKIGVVTADDNLTWRVVQSINGFNVTLTSALLVDADVNAKVFFYTTTAQQPIVVETVSLRDIDNQDIPVGVFQNVADYDTLPSKTDTTYKADPSSVYVEYQLGNSYLYTDVGAAEDVTKHLVITYLEAAQDFVNPNDTPEYPQEWYLPLSLGLAKLAAPMYGAPWTPLNESNYMTALAIAQKKEPEKVSTFFQPGDDW